MWKIKVACFFLGHGVHIHNYNVTLNNASDNQTNGLTDE